jgi:hypothetical protein
MSLGGLELCRFSNPTRHRSAMVGDVCHACVRACGIWDAGAIPAASIHFKAACEESQVANSIGLATVHRHRGCRQLPVALVGRRVGGIVHKQRGKRGLQRRAWNSGGRKSRIPAEASPPEFRQIPDRESVLRCERGRETRRRAARSYGSTFTRRIRRHAGGVLPHGSRTISPSACSAS